VHDMIWGYPPPYISVAPELSAQGQRAQPWPAVERVVQAVLQAVVEMDDGKEAGLGAAA